MDNESPYTPIPFDAPPPKPAPGERARYRPPIGIPVDKRKRVGSFVLSMLAHIILILLMIVPFTSPELLREVMGAGGPGPAGGGGGGGNKGTGGQPKTEHVNYVNVAPPPRPQVLPPLVEPPEIKPVVPPPVVPPPTPTPPTPQPPAPPAAEVAEAKAPVVGTGGGSGTDGSNGAGPGSGGGVSSTESARGAAAAWGREQAAGPVRSTHPHPSSCSSADAHPRQGEG